MKNLLLILTASLLLSACQQSKVADAKIDTAAENVQTVSAASTSALKFEHRTSAERAQIGVPYEIEIDFLGNADSMLNAEFSASPGLNMLNNKAASIQMKKSGKADTHTITVVPQSEGIHYVNIIQPGANQKPSVIRIIAGDKDIKEYLQTPGTLVEQEDGSKVISMKADEG